MLNKSYLVFHHHIGGGGHCEFRQGNECEAFLEEDGQLSRIVQSIGCDWMKVSHSLDKWRQYLVRLCLFVCLFVLALVLVYFAFDLLS